MTKIRFKKEGEPASATVPVTPEDTGEPETTVTSETPGDAAVAAAPSAPAGTAPAGHTGDRGTTKIRLSSLVSPPVPGPSASVPGSHTGDRAVTSRIRAPAPAPATGAPGGEPPATPQPQIQIEAGKKEEEEKKPAYQQTSVVDTGLVQQLDAILAKAISLDASDLHIEPLESKVIVRARIEGSLQQLSDFPINIHGKIVNRIKVLSAMDITKSKIPQSGFFKVVTDTAKIDVNTSTFPTLHGEKVLLKIHSKKGIGHSLNELGIKPEMLREYRANFLKPNGLILVAGPPGNGRTTTLYATLAELDSPEKSMASFETMVKYEIPGLIQGKPDAKADFTFETGALAMIDIEPDVLMIGEIQSPKVARAIVQASFSKRIVLGRILADNATNAIQNLIDMGLPPFLITSALNAILAQRLVRKLCPCKEPYTPPLKLLEELGADTSAGFFRPRGCPGCKHTGYSGYTGIFELLVMREELSTLIVAREPSRLIQETAVKLGLIPLKKDGISKAEQGITSIEEVLNVVI